MGSFVCLFAKVPAFRWGVVSILFGLTALGAIVSVITGKTQSDASAWITVIIFAFIAGYCGANAFSNVFSRKQRNPQNVPINATNSDIIPQAGDIVLTTPETYESFHKDHELIRQRRTKVVGVTFRNDDGTSRQTVLSHCHPHDEIYLEYFEYNGDPAYKVLTEHGQIGNLSASLASELDAYGDDIYVSGTISEVTGGYQGMSFGCNIVLDIYGPRNPIPEVPTHTITIKANPETDSIVHSNNEAGQDPVLDTIPTAVSIADDLNDQPSISCFDVHNDHTSEGIATTKCNDLIDEPLPEPDKFPIMSKEDTPTESFPVRQPAMVPEEPVPVDPLDWIRDPDVMDHYIVLDIETTGFSPTNDRIIEIAAVHYVFGSEASRFHTFVNPNIPIPKHITKLTGIHQSNVNSAPEIEDLVDDFISFIKDYPIVGHNIIDFDLPFLVAQFGISIPNTIIDTLTISKITFPDLPTYKLSDLKDWLRLHDGESHRADDDAITTNALLWACLYPEKYESLYRKAIRNGKSENKHTHESKSNRHFQHIDMSEIQPDSKSYALSGPLCGKKIVFTGELTISRKDAMQMAVNAGALLRSTVSGKTDILVVGKQDLSVVGADGMSTKEEKAHELNASGKCCIRIINEEEFMSLISAVSDSNTK